LEGLNVQLLPSNKLYYQKNAPMKKLIGA